MSVRADFLRMGWFVLRKVKLSIRSLCKMSHLFRQAETSSFKAVCFNVGRSINSSSLVPPSHGSRLQSWGIAFCMYFYNCSFGSLTSHLVFLWPWPPTQSSKFTYFVCSAAGVLRGYCRSIHMLLCCCCALMSSFMVIIICSTQISLWTLQNLYMWPGPEAH